MNFGMVFEIFPSSERFRTQFAAEWFFSSMDSHVSFQLSGTDTSSQAMRANVRFNSTKIIKEMLFRSNYFTLHSKITILPMNSAMHIQSGVI